MNMTDWSPEIIRGVERARAKTRGGLRLILPILLLALALVAAMVTAPPAGAVVKPGKPFMRSALKAKIAASPSATFRVIVQGSSSASSASIETKVKSAITALPTKGTVVRKRYAKAFNGVSAILTGKQIARLSTDPAVGVLTEDAKVAFTATNSQLWPEVVQAPSFWSSGLTTPAIAIVDTCVDKQRVEDFGLRVLTDVKLTNGRGNTGRDGRGHGTMVAGIAAGQAAGYSGYAPTANIVSIDVMDDTGAGYMSDVIDACDWILVNKATYGIRVANFSLHSADNSSFMYDPVNAAVEKLWLSGVVVVTAAGNYAVNGQKSGVLYSPANDPFVITVGAADTGTTVSTSDDFAAPWSANGYTLDGFQKPDIGAPGRTINGAVPTGSTMYAEHPERIVAPGYMWMSGTSFAAPVVAGAAAHVLAAHPEYTSDQVKGALMLSASPALAAATNSLGVGIVQGGSAASVSNPPNPNLALNGFLIADPNGGSTPVFDAASWSSAAQANASWSSASWSSASWASASWSSASWSSASWSSASWSSASWSSGLTMDSSLPTAAWATQTWVK